MAIKILNDGMECDIIKISNIVRNKALEILTGCYIFVQGNTVAAMGSFKGLKQVRRIVEDCIENKMHSVYHIKVLMLKRELAKHPDLVNENWDRFLPKFKKKNVKQNKVQGKEKKEYTPFPPPQQPSKIGIQLVTGEYFLRDKKKSEKKWHEKQDKQAEKTAETKRKREVAFVPPEESVMEGGGKSNDKTDITTMTSSLKEKTKELSKNKASKHVNVEDYIATTEKSSKKKGKKNKA